MDIAIALITLIALEIVLGIDNIIFISILSSKLPEEKQKKARLIGLALAMIMRVLLLFSISLIMKLTEPWFSVLGNAISGRDIILIVGGLFLIGKSTFEIHERLEGADAPGSTVKKKVVSFASIIVQIMLLDIVFSLDSVITAIGMASELWVMVTAVIASVIFMMFTSGAVSDFVHKHPTIKILALSFLLLIGVMLVAEGFDQHIPKGYVYFAMAFSVFVEMINIRVRTKRSDPVHLKEKKP
jgi:predicted tellurium resistance membrane protein TerC